MTEIFPPTETELNAMIKEVQKKMETADNREEYNRLHNRLKELREQKRQLIIKNKLYDLTTHLKRPVLD